MPRGFHCSLYRTIGHLTEFCHHRRESNHVRHAIASYSPSDHDPASMRYTADQTSAHLLSAQRTVLLPEAYVPWNAQAVLISYLAFWYATPSYCNSEAISMRYITTRLLWETDHSVAFVFIRDTVSNPHNYMTILWMKMIYIKKPMNYFLRYLHGQASN